MTVYLVLQWEGARWTVDNCYTALVPAGPYTSLESAHAAVEKAVAETIAETGDASYAHTYVRERVTVIPVEWPEEAKHG